MGVADWRAAVALPALAVLPTLTIRGDANAPREQLRHMPFDAVGICLVTLVAAGLAGTFQAPGTGAGIKLMALLGGFTALGVAALVRHVHREPRGFLPAALAGHKQFMLLNAGAMTLLGSYSVMLYAGPSVLRNNAGLGPVGIGLTLAPAAAVAALAAHNAPKAIARFGPTGIVIALCGMAAAGLLLASVGTDAPVLVLVATSLTVSAFSAGQATMQASTPALVPDAHVGAALGLFNFFFICGAAIGTSATAGSSAAVGLQSALLILSGLPLAGAVLAYSAQRVAHRKPRSVK